MKQLSVLILLLLFAIPSYAKVTISVEKFTDFAGNGVCAATKEARAELTARVRTDLIDTLMLMERYQIRQREIRPFALNYRLGGSIRTFEACSRKGKLGHEARIEIEIRLFDNKGNMTHMFSSSAKAKSGSASVAGEKAIHAAISEIARRVDGAIPGYQPTLLVYKGGRKAPKSDLKVQLIRRPSSVREYPVKPSSAKRLPARAPQSAPIPASAPAPGPVRPRATSKIAVY